MYERKKQKLISRKKFYSRIFKAVILDFFIILFSLMLGVTGYHFINDMPWVDAFVNASMILGGMGPVDALKNDTAKIFAGFYALFSGIAFLTGFAVLIAPLYHRFLHKFHLESE